MMKFIIQKLKKNLEIFALLSLIISATIFTSYYNYKKTIDNKIYIILLIIFILKNIKNFG